jgi:hypothetical protein
MRARLAGALLLLCSACLNEQDFLLPAAPETQVPTETTYTRKDRRTGKVIEFSERRRLASGRTVKDGVERRWYADGALRSERFYDQGEPTGRWKSWWEDGALRSDYTFHPLGEPTVMTWWHPNGRLSAQGPARRGTREGEWTYWYEDGTVREQGSFVLGVKDGEWSFFWEDGSLRSRGRYANGDRVGQWEHGPRPDGAREPDRAAGDEP